MSPIRRRFNATDSADVLASIADLLAEFRTSPSQEQITSQILNLTAHLIPEAIIAVLLHSPDRQEATIIQAGGYWTGLIGRHLSLQDPPSTQPGIWQDDVLLREAFPAPDRKSIRIMFVPLASRGRLLGALVFGSKIFRGAAYVKQELQLLSAIADITAGALLQVGLCERVDKQEGQILAMRSVGRAITSSLDLKVTLNVFLDLVTTQLEVDAASVIIQDAQSRDLFVAASRGFRNPTWQHARIRMDHSLASTAIMERKTVLLRGARMEDPALVIQPLMQSEKFLSYHATPLIVHGQVQGVLEVFRRSAGSQNSEWLDVLESLALQCAIAVDNAESFERLQRTHSELTMALDSTITGWSRAVDLRAQEAEGHSVRVSELAVRLAERMGIPPAQWVSIRRGALLHDIGKIGVPDSILWKPGSLSEEEWHLMRRHPEYAEELLAPIEFLRPAMDIPRYHHERWDGRGYPYALGGNDIPLTARLFSVVDVWDSLLARRPFRQPWKGMDAIHYLRENAGSHFEPDAVEAFIPIIEEEGWEPPLAI